MSLRDLIDKPVTITYSVAHSVGRVYAPQGSYFELNAMQTRADLGEDVLFKALDDWKASKAGVILRNRARTMKSDEYSEPKTKRPAEEDIIDCTSPGKAPTKIPKGFSFRGSAGSSSSTTVDLKSMGF